MRGLVFVLIVLLAFACNGDGEALRTATPGPSPGAASTPSPMGTAATPAATPTAAPASAPEIAYLSPDRYEIWLTALDGSGRRNVTQGRCPRLRGPYWSPKGDGIACIATGSAALPHTQVLVFGLEGRLILHIEHAAGSAGLSWPDMSGTSPSSLWSPDGRFLAYLVDEAPLGKEGMREEHTPVLYVAHSSRGILTSMPNGQQPRWSPDGGRLAYNRPPGETLVVYDLATGREGALGEDMRPLAWVLGGKALLVASGFHHPEEFLVKYEANVVDLTSGQMTRLPALDNSTQFWLSPDGGTAALVGRDGGYSYVGVLNLSSLQFTPVTGSIIRYPSDFIPRDHLTFSPDGSHIYWADIGTSLISIYKANSDGSGLTKVGELPGRFVAFSPDLRQVLYLVRSGTPRPGLWVANIDGSDARLVAEDAWGAAWRPTP